MYMGWEYGVKIGDELVESKSGTVVMEAHPDHDCNDDDVVHDSVGDTKAVVSPVELGNSDIFASGHTVQGSVDDATVSRNEIGDVMENFEKVMDNTLEDDSEIMEIDKMVEDIKPAPLSEKVASKKRKLNARDSGSWKLYMMVIRTAEMNDVQHIKDKENMGCAQDNSNEVVARDVTKWSKFCHCS
ncbi:hypothetical protein Tco_0987708 [Tanacetum coccineum]